MKRYSFDRFILTSRSARCGVPVLALAWVATYPVVTHAALAVPADLQIAQRAEEVDVLGPADVNDGLRIRLKELGTRYQSSKDRSESDNPRDYQIDEPPPGVDVPLPADAAGGEISEERLEERP